MNENEPATGTTQSMTARTQSMTMGERPAVPTGKRVGANGVMIGPWTPSVRRTNALLRSHRLSR